MMAVNCAGLPETLIQSELFGYEKGAFTHAHQAQQGLLESATGGTVFLDEIGEMPLSVQANLLRVLETREVLPVGGRKARRIDVRFVAATNRDLEAQVEKGTFRQDLLFRLNALTITVPSLRERREEILPLAHRFIEDAAAAFDRAIVPALSLEAAALLEAYPWPGNVRELKNTAERAVVLCEGDTIQPQHLPLERMGSTIPVAILPVLTAEETAERQRIIAALEENAGNQSRAARSINMPRRTFVAKLVRYGIPRPHSGRTPVGSTH
jgi:DNA-binding NtrC family response regulator